MTDLGTSGFDEFDRLVSVVRRTRLVLDALIGDGELPEGGAAFLADAALPHLEGIRDGFRGWFRAGGVDLDELRHLLLRAGEFRASQPRSLAERRAADAEATTEALIDPSRQGIVAAARLYRADPWHLASLAHARLVLAFLPHLPDDAVRFPSSRRTYADIPSPRGPAELADRIEELERELWRAATGRARATADPAFRRTYGFFDAADRLGGRTTFLAAG